MSDQPPAPFQAPFLEMYPVDERPPEVVPGRQQRAWMETFADRHAYRCLPLTMANTSGWEILNPTAFTAEWNGGLQATDITLTPDRPDPKFHDLVRSHFTHGILTFHTGYLLRTSPGWSTWCGGAPNHIKDGIQALSGLVETDWLPFPFTMNYRFTRPGKVRFEKGEPFCFFTLVQDKPLDEVQPVIKSLERNVELHGQYVAWYERRDEFNNRIYKKEPEALREAWQRFYFKGEMPEGQGEGPANHVNKRRLKPPRRGA